MPIDTLGDYQLFLRTQWTLFPRSFVLIGSGSAHLPVPPYRNFERFYHIWFLTLFIMMILLEK